MSAIRVHTAATPLLPSPRRLLARSKACSRARSPYCSIRPEATRYRFASLATIDRQNARRQVAFPTHSRKALRPNFRQQDGGGRRTEGGEVCQHGCAAAGVAAKRHLRCPSGMLTPKVSTGKLVLPTETEAMPARHETEVRRTR